MGTTRIKVIDLSSNEKEIKTSRKHAEKLTGAAKLKAAGPAGAIARREEKKPKKDVSKGPKGTETAKDEEEKTVITESTEVAQTTESKVLSQASEPSKPSQPAKPSVSGKKHTSLHHKGHKYLAAKTKIENGKRYPVKEAIALLSETSTVKFDPTVELHLNVVDKNVKGTVALPHPIETKTKEKRYLVFSEKKQEVNGVKVIWGDEKTITEIETGQLKPGRDFDAAISTPKFMPALAKIAKILGPAGMMPNPKNKTVTDDISQALKTKDEGFVFRTETQAPIIHTKLGKLSAKSEELEENLKALIFAIGPQKIKRAVINSTMSPSIKLDIASFSAK